MQIIREVQQLQGFHSQLSPRDSLGLVPTMGALHEGHISLVKQAQHDNTHVIVSIFVNPTQFAPGEDYHQYPRTLEADLQILDTLNVDAVFVPEISEIYPSQSYIQFQIHTLNNRLDGISRPGHMEGVLQIVSILFNLIRPQKAYFGLKDYQQYILIDTLVKELHFSLEVVPCPIVREADGLALSSRNIYLDHEQRSQAIALYQTLKLIKTQREKFKNIIEAKKLAHAHLQRFPLIRLDYFEILNGNTLEEIGSLDLSEKPHAFVAGYLGSTRLIDNMSLS